MNYKFSVSFDGLAGNQFTKEGIQHCSHEPTFSKTLVENDVENISKEESSDDSRE